MGFLRRQSNQLITPAVNDETRHYRCVTDTFLLGAVLSFGVARTVEGPDGPTTPEAMYERFCPYSKAFAPYEEYERWTAANPDVVSDIQPLDESLGLQAQRLADARGFADTERRSGATDDGCSC